MKTGYFILFYFILKRIFDIICAICGIIITSPVWLIAIIGIELADYGPVFYIADRVGKDNLHFPMYKFRSMRISKGANEKSFKADTNRIFPWGAFMRKSKIDELPQLLNLLLGDMSVVGPRLAASDQVDIVRGGKYSFVSTIKPGLTSPSALYDYIYGDTIEDEAEYQEKVLPTRLELDAFYVGRMSFFYDIKMIWYTVVCVVYSCFGKTHEGIYRELVANVDDTYSTGDSQTFIQM